MKRLTLALLCLAAPLLIGAGVTVVQDVFLLMWGGTFAGADNRLLTSDGTTGVIQGTDVTVIDGVMNEVTSLDTDALLVTGPTPAAGSHLVSVDATGVVTWSRPAYGSICTADGSTAITLTTADQWYPFVAADVDCGSQDGTNVTSSSATDSVTLSGGGSSGVYDIDLDTAFSGSVSASIHASVFVNDAVSKIKTHRKLSGSGDVGSAGASGQLTLAVGDILTVHFSASQNSKSVTVDHLNLKATRIDI